MLLRLRGVMGKFDAVPCTRLQRASKCAGIIRGVKYREARHFVLRLPCWNRVQASSINNAPTAARK